MTQVVFLIDVSTFHDSTQSSSKDENISSLKRSVLRILCYLANHYARRSECLQWSYKFFNSQLSPLQVMDKTPLRDFNLESFEEFEADVVKKHSRFMETLDRLDSRSQCEYGSSAITEVPRLSHQVLKEAIIQMFCDYAWDVPDMSSPDKICRKSGQRCNFVFIVSKVSQFVIPGDSCNVESILPPILLSSLTEKAYVYWIDVDFQKERASAVVFDRLKLLPLSATCNSYHHSGFPLSSVLSHFLFPRSNSNPFTATIVRSGKVVCTLYLYPALRNRSSDGQHKQHIAVEAEEKLSCLEITGFVESTPTVFASLEGDSFICASGGQTFDALLESLHSHTTSLVLSCTGSDNKQPQLGIFCPISISFASLAMLNPGPLQRKSNDLDTEGFAQTSFSVFDKLATAANERCAMDGYDITQYKASERRLALPLDMSVLEKWAIPQTIPFVDSVLQKVIKAPSRAGVTNLMKGLQKAYRPKYPNLVSTRTGKSASAQEFQMLKKSPKLRRCRSATLNVSQRSSHLVERSLQPRGGRLRSTPQTLSFNKVCKIPNHILNITQGYSDEATLFKYLGELYDAAVNGTSCLLTCAQTLVSVLSHHATISQTTARRIAEQHFLLSITKINEKHESDDLCKDKRLREYQLQTLLQLELESVSESNSPEAAEIVTVLLRTMSFFAGAQELNKFLHDTVKENYEETLKSFLEGVSDELSIPLFSSDSADDSYNYEDENPFSVSPSSASICSSVSLQETTQKKRNILVKHPSFTSDNQKRQIHIPKRFLPKRKTKQARVSVKKASLKFHHKVKLTEIGQVCRNLFKQKQPSNSPRSSPRRTPKLPFAPETPSEKQGRRAFVTSPVAEGKDLPTIVEESPCKVVLQRIDEEIHQLGYASFVATPSKTDPIVPQKASATPKTPRFRPKDTPRVCTTPRTPRSMGLTKSTAESTRSGRRLFASPKYKTPVRNNQSVCSLNVDVSPSTRCSPRLAMRSEMRPTRLSFSPRKVSANSENVSPSTRCSPQLAVKSETRSTTWSFSPRKVSVTRDLRTQMLGASDHSEYRTQVLKKPSIYVSPSTKCSPGKKSKKRPTRLSFSPRKVSAHNENMTRCSLRLSNKSDKRPTRFSLSSRKVSVNIENMHPSTSCSPQLSKRETQPTRLSFSPRKISGNSENTSPSARCPRQMGKKSETRPTRLSCSPRKVSAYNENATFGGKSDCNVRTRGLQVLYNEEHQNSEDEILLITPPPKKIHWDKGHKNGSSMEKPYVTPTALSLLHLTNSPVLDIIPVGKRTL